MAEKHREQVVTGDPVVVRYSAERSGLLDGEFVGVAVGQDQIPILLVDEGNDIPEAVALASVTAIERTGR